MSSAGAGLSCSAICVLNDAASLSLSHLRALLEPGFHVPLFAYLMMPPVCDCLIYELCWCTGSLLLRRSVLPPVCILSSDCNQDIISAGCSSRLSPATWRRASRHCGRRRHGFCRVQHAHITWRRASRHCGRRRHSLGQLSSSFTATCAVALSARNGLKLLAQHSASVFGRAFAQPQSEQPAFWPCAQSVCWLPGDARAVIAAVAASAHDHAFSNNGNCYYT